MVILGRNVCSPSYGRVFTRRDEEGPVQELAFSSITVLLRSSATRSSLITIHLLQPVFFLRSASRPGKLGKSDGWLSAGIPGASTSGHLPSIPSPRPSPVWTQGGGRGPEQELTLPPQTREVDIECGRWLKCGEVTVKCEQWSGPGAGAHQTHCSPLAIFCYQVFFDYDPSSSTSLLSSVGVTTRP